MNTGERLTVYTADWCGYCVRAKTLLNRHGVEYQERQVEGGHDLRETLKAETGGSTFPQIVLDGETIGGYAELVGLVRSGELDVRLG